ncbi:MAG: hypothetical protein M0R46_13845 [Candidatus Muirbacterium halophilum]|nr:hypothetical protein [Candidatus Muirbacterium halophilum]
MKHLKKFEEYDENNTYQGDYLNAPDEVVADVRNKLSPMTNLISMIEFGADKEYIEKLLPQVKLSINYLAKRKVY